MKNQMSNKIEIPALKLFLAALFISSFSITGVRANYNPPFYPANDICAITDQIFDVPLDAIFYNECCDEEVHVIGTAHIVVNQNIIHTVVSDITGTGLSTGYDYTGRGVSVETNVFYSNPFEGILTFKMNMVTEDGCSFKLKANFHLVLNANGEVVVSFVDFNLKCS